MAVDNIPLHYCNLRDELAICKRTPGQQVDQDDGIQLRPTDLQLSNRGTQQQTKISSKPRNIHPRFGNLIRISIYT